MRLFRWALAGIALASSLCGAATVPMDRVAVVVDDGIIMESEIRERINTAAYNLQSRGAPLPPEDVFRQEIIKLMVLESIQLQMAERAGVRISDNMLNAAIADIAARSNMTLEQFRAALQTQGISYDSMREQVRTQMVTQRVQRGNVAQKVFVSEDEITGFLASEEGQQLIAPELHLDHLLLEVPLDAPAATRSAARAAALQLLQDSRKQSLASLAARKDLPVTARQNDLGWRKPQDIPSLFAGQLLALATGETAGPFESDSGYHLVKVLERRGMDRHIVQQTRARHILVKPSEIRSEEQAKALAAKLRQRIIDGEDFATLARQYSEDIGSAMEGGDLGWANPGQFVPEFTQAMDATAINGISQPFRSEFGWHILQVIERREKDMGSEIQRNMARQILFERKYEDELAAWLVKIRDEAYVDIK
ncbi:MAG: molecular chaperone SurA [Gammaproteobacteria bacterium]|nr:MAG: molecular chaperone SurA [Gammaproteobacteria bacterium]